MSAMPLPQPATPIPADVLAEIQQLAADLAAARDASNAADTALQAAKDAQDSAAQQYSDLRKQLYARLRAGGITPTPFVQNGLTFSPVDDFARFDVWPTPPSLATALGG